MNKVATVNRMSRVNLLITTEIGVGGMVFFEPEGAALHLAANDQFHVEIGASEGPIEITYGKNGLTIGGDAGTTVVRDRAGRQLEPRER